MQGQPAFSWWSSHRHTTQSSPWPSGYLTTHMCNAISDLSCYTAVQSLFTEHGVRGSESMRWDSLTGTTLLTSHTALDSESALSPRNLIWSIYLLGGILLIDLWINLLLYFSSILGSDIACLFFDLVCSLALSVHSVLTENLLATNEYAGNDGKNQEDYDQLPCLWTDFNL